MILTMDAKRRLTVPTGLSAAQPGDAFDVTIDPEDDAICLSQCSLDVLQVSADNFRDLIG